MCLVSTESRLHVCTEVRCPFSRDWVLWYDAESASLSPAPVAVESVSPIRDTERYVLKRKRAWSKAFLSSLVWSDEIRDYFLHNPAANCETQNFCLKNLTVKWVAAERLRDWPKFGFVGGETTHKGGHWKALCWVMLGSNEKNLRVRETGESSEIFISRIREWTRIQHASRVVKSVKFSILHADFWSTSSRLNRRARWIAWDSSFRSIEAENDEWPLRTLGVVCCSSVRLQSSSSYLLLGVVRGEVLPVCFNPAIWAIEFGTVHKKKFLHW